MQERRSFRLELPHLFFGQWATDLSLVVMETFLLECHISSIQGTGRRKLLFNRCFLCIPTCVCRDILSGCVWWICRTSKAFSLSSICSAFFSTCISSHRTLDLGWWLVSGARETRFCRLDSCPLNRCHGSSAATILLKPRIGKYNSDGTANKLSGHNQVYTALGVLI